SLNQVLYTHQKMKKSKTWQDGILRIRTGGNKAVLFDDKGQCLESIFIKSQLNAGDNLESERYLITIEAVALDEKSSKDQPRKAEIPAVNNSVVKPLRHLPVGLKRKFTGFQVPRQVEKKILTEEDEGKAPVLPLSEQCQGSFPSRFYITSPLFSTICKKDTDANIPTDFHEEVYTNSDKERTSFPSLFSAPFLDTGKDTGRRNSDESVVKPEYSAITEHTKTTGHVAVSQNIRSTAQIIALLKSKPAQPHREQATSAVTECHPRFQTSDNIGGGNNRNRTTLPSFSGNPDIGLDQNIQQQRFTEETESDKRGWHAEMLLNSAEQPCDEEVVRQTPDRKADNLSQDLQEHFNTKTLRPGKIIGKMSDSQFTSSLSDISYSASPAESTAFEINPSTSGKHSVISGLTESQNELQPRQNSEIPSSELELSAGMALSELEAVEEESIQGFPFDGEIDGNLSVGDISLLPRDNNAGDSGRAAEDSVSLTRIEMEFSEGENKTKQIKESQLNIEARTSQKDLDGCAENTIIDKPIKGKDSNSCISASGMISVMDKRTEDLLPLGYTKSQYTDLEHCQGSSNGDITPGSPFPALLQVSDASCRSLKYSAEDQQNVFDISCKEDTVISTSTICLLGKGHSSPEETEIGETEFENIESISSLHDACEGERIGMDCLKSTAFVEKSSELPDLVNNIALLRALTEHSTALESLQKIQENSSLLYE
ncbi:ZGRF1 protein, partial [Nothoprocta pentlandii]|nr:ZGRF1 protein [Nothoprocta pentlandii]